MGRNLEEIEKKPLLVVHMSVLGFSGDLLHRVDVLSMLSLSSSVHTSPLPPPPTPPR